jgi:hypothetical protein
MPAFFKSVFAEFGNAAIFGKWSRMASPACPNFFCHPAQGLPGLCTGNILIAGTGWIDLVDITPVCL